MEIIPPSQKALAEALELSEVILKNIELSELPLANIALKASRLARLLNDFVYQKIMEYEAGSYPQTPTGIPPEAWQLANIALRTYQEKDSNGAIKEYAYTESIEQLEQTLQAAKLGLDAARDRDVSVSSANPTQFVMPPMGNFMERNRLQSEITRTAKRISNRRTFIYNYALRKYQELKYSSIAGDTFSRIRENTDHLIGKFLPDSVQKFSAVYENLLSENTENWSNAVHSCRRILQDLADIIFPTQTDDRVKHEGSREIRVKLGRDNYVNRIICFVEDNSNSSRFNEIVGSHLKYLGERLDSIFSAAQKGSHKTIMSREEADRYVVFTYMIVGDVLSLWQSNQEKEEI